MGCWMPKFKIAFEETTTRIATVYAENEQAARDLVAMRQEDDNYEDPSPVRMRTIIESGQVSECDC